MKLIYITSFDTEDDAENYAVACMNGVVIQRQDDNRWHLWIYA
jgi:hypothetical protein